MRALRTAGTMSSGGDCENWLSTDVLRGGGQLVVCWVGQRATAEAHRDAGDTFWGRRGWKPGDGKAIYKSATLSSCTKSSYIVLSGVFC